MGWSYEYTPHIWLILSSAAFLTVLGIYGLRHRCAPGAVFFIILLTMAILWVLANGLGLAGRNDTTRIFWFKFQTALMIPMATAGLCFALEYAGLGKWLSRRMIVLLTIVPLAFVLLILTNENHHLVWRRIWFDGSVRSALGPAHWGAFGVGYLLTLLQLIVLAWLFQRSPRHRWIAGGLMIALFSMRGAASLNVANWNPVSPVNPMIFVLNFAVLLYALAIVRFRMFDVVPVARDTVIERISDGMLVLDVENRIADVNETSETILGAVRPKIIGRRVSEVLQAYPALLGLICDPDETKREISFQDTHNRWYHVSISPLIDRRGFQLGRLIWFHDTTEQKRAQAKILDRQRTLAMLKERELLGRELHDGIGQMLAAVHLQVKSASELLARSEIAMVEGYLRRIAEVTQATKESIRQYLLGVNSHSPADQSFLSMVRQYLKNYSRDYGVHTELVTPPEFGRERGRFCN